MTSILLVALLACGGRAAVDQAPALPESLVGQACGVCGMVVQEQPPPRAQLVHRDDVHVHFCSVGDLRAYLDAPSPHGPPRQAWVEVVPGDFDIGTAAALPLPLLAVEEATYVVGFTRPLVMGRPALAFEAVDEARSAAARLGGFVVGWETLRATPSHLDPERQP